MTSGAINLNQLIANLKDSGQRLGDDAQIARLMMAVGEIDVFWICHAVREGMSPEVFVDFLNGHETHLSVCIGRLDGMRELAIVLMEERMQYVGGGFSIRKLMESALTSRQPYANGTVHSKMFRLFQETRPPF